MLKRMTLCHQQRRKNLIDNSVFIEDNQALSLKCKEIAMESFINQVSTQFPRNKKSARLHLPIHKFQHLAGEFLIPFNYATKTLKWVRY